MAVQNATFTRQTAGTTAAQQRVNGPAGGTYDVDVISNSGGAVAANVDFLGRNRPGGVWKLICNITISGTGSAGDAQPTNTPFLEHAMRVNSMTGDAVLGGWTGVGDFPA